MWILNGNTETPVSLPRVMEEKRTLEDGTKTKVVVSTSDLTVEDWDRLGYNETIPHSKGDPFTEYETEWSKDDDLIYREKVVTFSVDEEAKAEFDAGTIRAKRNRLLSECDWTQTADAPVNKTSWAVYRQVLRDLPQQNGFPWSVEWPVTPDAKEQKDR